MTQWLAPAWTWRSGLVAQRAKSSFGSLTWLVSTYKAALNVLPS